MIFFFRTWNYDTDKYGEIGCEEGESERERIVIRDRVIESENMNFH